MVSQAHGRRESLVELRRRFPISLTGASLKSLIAIADAIGFTSRPVRCELDELTQLELPAILHWDLDHYVVLVRAGRTEVVLHDPARGERRLPWNEVSKHFTGVALELTCAPNFEKKAKAERVRLGDLWTRLSGFTPVLIQMLLLTLLLQGLGLLAPLSNQLVVDDVIGRGDKELLLAVLIGFLALAAIQTAVDALRGFIQLYAGQRLSLQLAGNLLKHLLRLPTDYFERRHVGDVMTRFGSLAPVQSFLTAGIVGAVLDGVMIVPAAIIMVMYSWKLSLLVAAELLLVTTVRAVTFPVLRRYNDESLHLSARTQSVFLETVRAVRAIKLAGREAERHGLWRNSTVDQQNLAFKQSVFGLWGAAGMGMAQTGLSLFMLYLGAMEVMQGRMSLGMYFAFQSYAGQFTGRANSLMGLFFSFKMLGLHLERLGDVVHADPEPGLDATAQSSRPLRGDLALRGLKFRYAPQDPWVLVNVDLDIEAGQAVTFVGPSGGGKSTLLKVLTALYAPTEGEVLYDGHPIAGIGLRTLRDRIGVVMQDDQLLSGTLADNIAFFDTQIDMDRVEAAARAAHVHDDIMKTPMGYHSLIGDMGSILSGGQKQRVLLARALYKQPAILFMDEGTANLDPDLERKVMATLAGLKITRIMVAHREAAVRNADRVFRVDRGRVTEVTGVELAPYHVTAAPREDMA